MTLVELMIAIALALLVVLAATYAYLAGVENSRSNRALSRMALEATSALHQLGAQIRSAGFSHPRSNAKGLEVADRPLAEAAFTACDGGFVDAAAPVVSCKADLAGPDGLVVLFEADRLTGRSDAAAPLDCTGQPLPESNDPITGVNATIVANRFYVEAAGDQKRLVCRGVGGAAPYASAVPIANGVEDMQFHYVTRRDDGSGATMMLTAQEVEAQRAVQPAIWKQVAAISVCVVVVSPTELLASPAAYQNCHGGTTVATDRRIRRKYSTLLAARNQAESGL